MKMLDDILNLLDSAMGIANDFSDGVDSLKKANADSAVELADAIYSKKTVAETGAAVERYEAAAMAGDEGAQNRLVALYCIDPEKQDYEKAAYWAQVLADKGDADALAIVHKIVFNMLIDANHPVILAATYYDGTEDKPRDMVKAAYWIEKAALIDPTVLDWPMD